MRSARSWWQISPQWAIAAALVLLTPVLLQISRNPDRGAEGQGRPAPVVTRTPGPVAAELQVLLPGEGAEVASSGLSFAWTEIQGTPFYDVRIVTDAGDVVVRQRVTGTKWRPPANLHLQPGAEYFVHVEAYPFGDKALSSEHVRFRVAN
jgi:hypothetical protein